MNAANKFTVPVKLASTDSARSCVDAEQFALQVTDRSMEPELPEGCVVVIDPAEPPVDGDIVIADMGEGAGIIIGRLRREGERACVVIDHPATTLPLAGGLSDVRGVVVQQVSGNRSTRKRYR